MQAGLIALTECIHKNTGPNSDVFAAYAKIRIKGAMLDQLRKSAPLSRSASQKRRELRNAERQLSSQLGRQPTAAELAQAMGIETDQLHAMLVASEPLRFESIDETYSDSDLAFRDHSENSLELLVSKENRETLIAAIANLPERLQLVIQLYFVEEFNLAEIAAILGVTVPRVHQLKDQALRKLKEELLIDRSFDNG